MTHVSQHLSHIHTCNMCMFEQAVPLAVHAGKFFWFLLFQFLTLDYFTHVGIMSANLSPSLQIATTVVLTLVPTWNVLSGFYVPKPVSSVHTQPSYPFLCACTSICCLPGMAKGCGSLHSQSKQRYVVCMCYRYMICMCSTALNAATTGVDMLSVLSCQISLCNVRTSCCFACVGHDAHDFVKNSFEDQALLVCLPTMNITCRSFEVGGFGLTT